MKFVVDYIPIRPEWDCPFSKRNQCTREDQKCNASEYEHECYGLITFEALNERQERDEG